MVLHQRYGLLVPKKANQGPLQPRLAIFGDNSDSDNDGGADWVKKALKQESEKGVQKKQTKLEMQRALEQDPTVYQYDEIYDKLEERKTETKAIKKDQEKKPRYIQSLMKQAERRKREQERRVEREVQKEREAEGEEFKDKEEFVTSAYRKKLEEFKKLDEEERLQDHIDALVPKQKDLSGFYHHLYKQVVGEEDCKDSITMKQDEVDKNKSAVKDTSDTVGTSKSENKGQNERKIARQYRKRKNSSSESEKDENKISELKTNVDADSDFTGHNSDSDGSDNEKDMKKRVKINAVEKKSKSEVFTSGSEEGEIKEANDAKTHSKNEDSSELIKVSACNDSKKLQSDESGGKEKEKDKRISGDKEADKENCIAMPEPPKCSIWEKRTAGPVFEAALERYFARKATKSAS
ncbi:nuclear speckle splicing regulatory protein 1 isoform X2 [Zootermopsis nevadensis]|uniref:nuclear speckle splicing regulatory protein 1 isoform X2 n=1 Tax=Zootermopsis nevadensis TaxID=136037 RepID=UPI000B8E5C0D|nr:nuclear speckle splicing regulatory protein 1 isoform X2 [Zootermopsis nevadensis]